MCTYFATAPTLLERNRLIHIINQGFLYVDRDLQRMHSLTALLKMVECDPAKKNLGALEW